MNLWCIIKTSGYVRLTHMGLTGMSLWSSARVRQGICIGTGTNKEHLNDSLSSLLFLLVKSFSFKCELCYSPTISSLCFLFFPCYFSIPIPKSTVIFLLVEMFQIQDNYLPASTEGQWHLPLAKEACIISHVSLC